VSVALLDPTLLMSHQGLIVADLGAGYGELWCGMCGAGDERRPTASISPARAPTDESMPRNNSH
jgi:hypothetical protein